MAAQPVEGLTLFRPYARGGSYSRSARVLFRGMVPDGNGLVTRGYLYSVLDSAGVTGVIMGRAIRVVDWPDNSCDVLPDPLSVLLAGFSDCTFVGYGSTWVWNFSECNGTWDVPMSVSFPCSYVCGIPCTATVDGVPVPPGRTGITIHIDQNVNSPLPRYWDIFIAAGLQVSTYYVDAWQWWAQDACTKAAYVHPPSGCKWCNMADAYPNFWGDYYSFGWPCPAIFDGVTFDVL